MKSTKNKSTDQDKEFPGYPLYAPEEDIMNNATRIETNLDDESIPVNKIKSEQEEGISITEDLEDNVTPANEFTVTEEDLEALGPKDLSMDMGDDEQLKHRITPVDFSAEDLDIPGSELDDADEAIGSEDEENNSYSLGSDANNALEEDPS